MTSDFDDAPKAALDWVTAGQGAALATVVETWGSAPRPVGSQVAISDQGALVGSVSGGCVEGAVVAEAQEAIRDGQLRLLDFGVSDEDAFAVGLACGGRIRVLVEPVSAQAGRLTPALLGDLVAARGAGQAVAYVVDSATGQAHLAGPETYADRFRADRSGFEADSRTFVAIHTPPLRLIVIGGVHIAQALVPMARIAGYRVTLIDPREAFANAARFPDTALSHDWPDDALSALAPDGRTAVVTLTHDAKLDDPALHAALDSEAFYIGCLGSTRTHAKRVARLTEAGVDAAQLSRLHAPVGLAIGARSPAEIAVSVLAQITQRLRHR